MDSLAVATDASFSLGLELGQDRQQPLTANYFLHVSVGSMSRCCRSFIETEPLPPIRGFLWLWSLEASHAVVSGGISLSLSVAGWQPPPRARVCVCSCSRKDESVVRVAAAVLG